MTALRLPRLLVGTAAVLVTVAAPVAALTSISPTELDADTDVTLTLTSSSDGLDPTTGVSAALSAGFVALACGAPDGWGCSIEGATVTWERGASLAPDEQFTMAVHTPATAGVSTFTLTDVHASGDSSTNVVTVTVLEPTPTATETETATPTETETPEPEPTTAPTVVGSSPPLEPFRPPSDASDRPPISIQDLPSDAIDASAADPTAARVVATSPLTVTTLLAAMVSGLLGLSALGFLVARTNR